MKAVIVIWIVALLALLGLAWMVNYAPVVHGAYMPVSQKYDGDCTGLETVGRCANKIVQPTPEPSEPLPAVYGGK